ncbi:BRCT domain-containing protein [Ruminococcus sp.]|uniref:BRCT domain-containing protein n=1 Tax=Ruminococcus sp. TaxID=41978 RepID=UPI0025FE8198|nr:BRCT domain-containing protein [Ruminococcus sp.]MBR1433062.1 BRCT domain-containing protein [Ruminococcus sp.]
MKFRTGFVTNSSSYSALVIHKIESETLEKIFKEHGLELSIITDIGIHEDPDIISSSVSDTLVSIFEDQVENDLFDIFEKAESEVSSDDISDIMNEIVLQKHKIDKEASCYIQSVDETNEFDCADDYMKDVIHLDDEDIDVCEEYDYEGNEVIDALIDKYITEKALGALMHTVTLDINHGTGRLIHDYNCICDDDNFKKYLKDLKVYPVILSGKTFVVTGKLKNYTREIINQKIKLSGGIVKDSITSDTDYLITNYPESTTSKMKKARELGTTIISEKEFDKMYEELSKGIDLSLKYKKVVKL